MVTQESSPPANIREWLAAAQECLLANDPSRAKDLYYQILEQDPWQADALCGLALLLQGEGALDKAITYFRKAMTANPMNPLPYYHLGMLLDGRRERDEARVCYQQALRLKPDYLEAHFNLGNMLHATGCLEEAAEHFSEALRLKPDLVSAHFNLGNVLRDLSRPQEALGCYEETLRLNPNHPGALSNLGILYQARQNYSKAMACFGRLRENHPNSGEPLALLGHLFRKMGKLDEAVSHYQQALQMNAATAETHIYLALTLSELKRYDEALPHFEEAVRLKPDFAEAHYILGNALLSVCRTEEAKAHFLQAYQLRPQRQAWQLRAETLCPVIPSSSEEIAQSRRRITGILNHTMQAGLRLNICELMFDWCQPSSYLPYHGENDRDIKSLYGDLFTKALGLNPAPNAAASGWKDDRPHIGFLVTHDEVLFCRAMGGMLDRLSRERFRMSIICPQNAVAYIASHIRSEGVHFITLHDDLAVSASLIKAQNMDLIHFFEVGTHPKNYFLPFFRLAPIQCTSCWGFPVTTGIPAMDYFISSETVESENAQEHYREELVLLKSMPVYMERPPLPEVLKSRSDFGLPEEAHLYCCPQNLFKFHPDFDPILAGILKQDPEGTLLLFTSHYRGQDRFLWQRLSRSIPNIEERVRMLPRFGRSDYMNILALSDVILDTIHFGGGITTFEGLSVGTPIVTLPTPFMRSRMAYACYQRMGLMDGVASDAEDYVRIAVRLGGDADYRNLLREKIRSQNSVLFEDIRGVEELETFFIQAIQGNS